MSDPLTTTTIDVLGRPVRLLEQGSGGRVVLLAHTGAPGASPFAGSADLFAGLMRALRLPGTRLVAPDLPGAGGTALRGLEDLTPAGVTRFLTEVVGALGPIDELHVVGHGNAALSALELARDGAGDVDVASCVLVAPNAAAPIGDSIQNVSLLNPPVPLWSLRSQRWAVRRLAYVPDRVPEALLETMVANAAGEPARAAAALLADPVNASALVWASIEAQDAFYAACRETPYTVPISIFWGAQDPTATVARGTVLAEILGGGPAPLDFHLVNQCGHLAQFDREFQLARVVSTAVARASRRAVVASA